MSVVYTCMSLCSQSLQSCARAGSFSFRRNVFPANCILAGVTGHCKFSFAVAYGYMPQSCTSATVFDRNTLLRAPWRLVGASEGGVTDIFQVC